MTGQSQNDRPDGNDIINELEAITREHHIEALSRANAVMGVCAQMFAMAAHYINARREPQNLEEALLVVQIAEVTSGYSTACFEGGALIDHLMTDEARDAWVGRVHALAKRLADPDDIEAQRILLAYQLSKK